MAFHWDVKPTDTFPEGYAQYTRAVYVTGRRVAESRAEQMLAWARQNAPWNDVTGAARAGLNVTVTQAPGVVAEITLAHDPALNYPVYLETRFAGRDAIIAPSVDVWGAIFQRDMTRIVNLQLATKG
jgi:hypothetical protein